jgi:hypothetical protein
LIPLGEWMSQQRPCSVLWLLLRAEARAPGSLLTGLDLERGIYSARRMDGSTTTLLGALVLASG